MGRRTRPAVLPRPHLLSRLIRRGRARLSRSDDAGFGALELVIVTPVLLVMLLLVVGFGRLTHGRQLVQQAAAAAARAATLDSDPGQAGTDAEQAAHDTLTQAGVSCRTFNASVDTGDFRPGGQVTVTVTCTTSLSDLGLVGFPGAKTLTASATSPLEQYRQYGSAT
jgi:Flp pilus assembly protein TadG